MSTSGSMDISASPTDEFSIEDLGVVETDVYDVEVEDYHNFFANNVAVHNSVYINTGPFVARYLGDKPRTLIVDRLDKFCKSKLDPLIAKTFEDIATYLNAHTKCLTMVRDVIADRGVWTAKKRYILNVWDSEGVRYDKPQLKIMGIEAIKSSTPSICRDIIIHALDLFMNGTQQELWDYIAKSQAEFMKAPFEDVAFPRSVNGLKKYTGQSGAVPIHVKGALTFNETLVRRPDAEEEPIYEGQKIRFAYLRTPNPFGSHVMSAPDGCPASWQIENYLDYHKQWEKSLLEPLNAILECAGWSAIRVASLFD